MGAIVTKSDANIDDAQTASAEPLTADEEDAIRASWGVMEKSQRALGIAFFVKLFEEHPQFLQTFARFRHVPADDLPNCKALHAHALTFMRGMGALVENVDDLECLDELLHKIAARHEPLGLKEADIKTATDSFVRSLHPNAAFDGLDHGSEFIAASWGHAFDVINPIIGKYMRDLEKKTED